MLVFFGATKTFGINHALSHFLISQMFKWIDVTHFFSVKRWDQQIIYCLGYIFELLLNLLYIKKILGRCIGGKMEITDGKKKDTSMLYYIISFLKKKI